MSNLPVSVSSKHLFVPSPVSGKLLEDETQQLAYSRLFETVVVLKITGARLFAPFDGYVSQVDPLNQSIRFTCLNGLKFWFKMGKQTMHLHTRGFQMLSPVGKKVARETALVQVNLPMLKQEDMAQATIMLINGNKLKGFEIKKARQYLASEDILMKLEF
ncbi:PTS glucose transporter subunit IIA [Salinimonas chungwhensis]|uniref:PTS glucose transporter subunit IIA n=1 Tax=Salinimonas chungwhensis TaxID=265425 RepID=UPI000364D82E|nr:PTS glucose transporter subunit IIA [Salinimonas chungwhensis]